MKNDVVGKVLREPIDHMIIHKALPYHWAEISGYLAACICCKLKPKKKRGKTQVPSIGLVDFYPIGFKR